MRSPSGRGWPLRTSFGEEVVVVRAWDAGRHDGTYRMPSPFMRFELRRWLLRRDGFERDAVMRMYREIRGEPTTFAFSGSSPSDLMRHVLPVLEDAFERGRLVAFKVPAVRVDIGPPRSEGASADHESEGADWVEIIVANDAHEPYLGPYRLDLPDGRTLSGRFNTGGSARVDGIPGGSCTVAFPELQVSVVRGM